MLVDIGTNGEMALWREGTLTVCSTAAGPAFEGVGISMGMRASFGAIDRVTLEDKKIKAHVIGDGAPVGICGSGLVDAVACLLKSGALDESGYLGNDAIAIQDSVSVTQEDIRMLQLAKSAIFAGLVTLVRTQQISFTGIASLAIAGGFGCYLNTENAALIGLLPKELVKKSLAVGNAALDGASMILLNDDFKQASERIAKRATVIDLASNPIFSEAYMLGMILGENAGDTIY